MKSLFFTLTLVASLTLFSNLYAETPEVTDNVSAKTARVMHQQKPDSLRILWIGNSFTYKNNMPAMFDSLCKINGVNVASTRIVKGGEKFSGHLKNPRLRQELEKGCWDYVVMQEYSNGPAYSTKFVAENILPYAAEIDSLVKKYSPSVETIYYMTWGHKNGNVKQTDYPFDDNYEDMQNRIITTYIDMAYENGGTVAPVGIAWKNIRRDHPEIELYVKDNYHPSVAGSYLAANVLFATIFNKQFKPLHLDGLNDAEAEALYREALGTIAD